MKTPKILLVILIGLAQTAQHAHAAECSALHIAPVLQASVEPSEIQRVLIARLGRLADRKVLSNTAMTYLSRDKLSLELPGTTCEAAREFFASYLAQATRVEVGLVGADPVFDTSDFDPLIEMTDSAVSLRVRDEVEPRLHAFSAENLGKEVFIRLGGTEDPYVIEIRAANNTGVIAVPIDRVAESFRKEPRLLATELRVVGCGACEGDYAGGADDPR